MSKKKKNAADAVAGQAPTTEMTTVEAAETTEFAAVSEETQQIPEVATAQSISTPVAEPPVSPPVYATPAPTHQGTAPATKAERKSSTIIWGVVMILLGSLTIGLGFGLEVNFSTWVIALLVIIGVGFLVAAILPERKKKPKVKA